MNKKMRQIKGSFSLSIVECFKDIMSAQVIHFAFDPPGGLDQFRIVVQLTDHDATIFVMAV